MDPGLAGHTKPSAPTGKLQKEDSEREAGTVQSPALGVVSVTTWIASQAGEGGTIAR